jgi:DNA-binding transcriptional ArsR family regulator
MEITQLHAEVCGALADFHRLLLVYALAERKQNVSELVARLGLSQPTISRHLKILRDCGVVSAERQGRAVYYMPADHRIIEALDLIRAAITDRLMIQGDAAREAGERPSPEYNTVR